MGVSDARVVDSHTGHGDIALSIAEALGSDGIRWHEEENDKGPEDSNSTGNLRRRSVNRASLSKKLSLTRYLLTWLMISFNWPSGLSLGYGCALTCISRG